MLNRRGTVTSPSSGVSSPTIIRKTVVFPAPFGPTRPARSCGFSWNEASTNRTCLPYCLETLANEIIGQGKGLRSGPGLGSEQGDEIGAAAGVGPLVVVP